MNTYVLLKEGVGQNVCFYTIIGKAPGSTFPMCPSVSSVSQSSNA